MSLNTIPPNGDVHTPSSSLSPHLQNCQICDGIAHGTHFGAQTCRACAAFFRRTIVKNLKYQCGKVNDACVVVNVKENVCKFCRFQKCINIGMKDTNVQYNRDSTLSTVQRTLGKRCSPGNLSLEPGWRRNEVLPPAFDMTNIFRKVKRIFTKFEMSSESISHYSSSNSLEKMNFALGKSKLFRNWNRVTISQKFHLKEVMFGWSELMIGAAKWMMHSEEFRDLSPTEKFEMFMGTWHIWAQVEKIRLSFKVFGERVVKEKIIMMSPSEAYHLDDVDVDFSAVTNRSNEEIVGMFHPLLLKLFEDVVKPLIDIDPCQIELTFLLCQGTFHLAGTSFSGNISLAADRFADRVSNDLHEFYTRKNNTGNYAGRLLKLMRIKNSLENIFKERRKLLDLAHLFDVFKCRFSEPQFFE